MKRVAIIGAGFAGLSAAARLAKNGFDVTVFEKNSGPGGRGRKFESEGFIFDMGPSWYWMPDVFEKFFNLFGKKTADFYTLIRLDPSYRVLFSKQEVWDVPAGTTQLSQFFNEKEKGSAKKLEKFLNDGKVKYELAMNELVYAPGLSVFELLKWKVIKGIFSLSIFQSVSSYVRKYFKDPRLIQLLEFPVLFLGASAKKTPALYTLMNYADAALGTWYPQGGMYKIVEALVEVAKSQGAKLQFDSPVQKILISRGMATSILVKGVEQQFDFIVGAGDYHHIEQQLLPKEARNYSRSYWQSRKLAPSCLIFYLGVNKKLKNLRHHNLFFDADFKVHSSEIYDHPEWPTNPLFYVSAPSVTDPTVAPSGCENIFILIPVAPGLKDDEVTREKYFKIIMERLEKLTSESVLENIIYKRSYALSDFIKDYNSFKGNAYGLANTILQTANLKPSMRNPKVKNLFYTGQLTVPGPGVPPSLISGQIVADQIEKIASMASNKIKH